MIGLLPGKSIERYLHTFMSDSVYLHDIPLAQAKDRLDNALRAAGLMGILGAELIPLSELAIGRVLSEPVWAKISSPHYHASAMDGFAVRAEDTEEALQTNPVMLVCGPVETQPQAAYLDTGDPLPAWANAVIPIENVEPLVAGEPAPKARQPELIRIRAAVPPLESRPADGRRHGRNPAGAPIWA